jgi:hypothetical protein
MRRWALVGAVLFASVLPAGLARADTWVGGGSSISGTVTDSVTHAPIRDICVSAFDDSTYSYGSATTDATGRYAIRNLAPGDYELSFFQCSIGYYIPSFGEDHVSLRGVDASTPTGLPPSVHVSGGD